MPAVAEFLQSWPTQLALVTPVEVFAEGMLFTGAYSRKHLKAFLKLITCFPESGLLCIEGLDLAQCWPSALAWALCAREVAGFAPA